jgi:hypothetical protein
LELKCAVHVQIAEHLLPENGLGSTANFSHGLNTDETRIFLTRISRIDTNGFGRVLSFHLFFGAFYCGGYAFDERIHSGISQ